MSELRANPDFVKRTEAREQERARRCEEGSRAVAPILADLAAVGVDVSSLSQIKQLTPRKRAYKMTLPVLLKWLPLVEDRGVKTEIVHALSVAYAKPLAGPALIEEFRKAPSDEGLKWEIGSALEFVADDSVFEELSTLVRDKSHGRAREMLAVALGNMTDPRAVGLLVAVLEDDATSGHAVMGLGKLGEAALPARGAIEPFLDSPKQWVRAEAKKALARLAKCRSPDRRHDPH